MKTKVQRDTRSEPRRRLGFTLVEMLLVLVILATLAAIVYPKVMGRTRQANETAVKTQINSFKTALDAFEIDNGFYPKGRNGLQELFTQPRDAVKWHGPYMDSLPKDPWQQEYIYECPGKHNPAFYDIYSPGPPGEQMQIGNWDPTKR